MEAIILAGGKGTRLQSVVSDLPKPMAPIGAKPFLYYQMQFLKRQGVSRFVLAVGYLYEKVQAYFGESFEDIPIKYVIEHEPLGTGGGVKFALGACETNDVLLCNGDTFFSFNLTKLSFAHQSFQSSFTFSVHKVYNTGRYGGMSISDDAKVKAFVAKDIIGETYINAGAYIVNKESFLKDTASRERFSLEDDFLAKKVGLADFYAVPFTGANFLDIGIPEDYSKGQDLIPLWAREERPLIKTIFLDRDGVINKKIDNDYVRNTSQLEILPGVINWISDHKNNLLIVVTNQRGIGKGLMSLEDVEEIHDQINLELNKEGAQIARFYVCPATESSAICRKPNPGMLEQASSEFAEINKNSTVLIGDSLSDLQAARAFGIPSVYLTNGQVLRFEVLESASLVTTSLQHVDLSEL